MAFDGKTLIHPTQISPANEAFSPSATAVADARRIVAVFARTENAGAGVVNLDGKMVERLHLAQAQALLAIHDAIERRTVHGR
ncbi:(3S)-malyl-CoA thioesterase [compost metagenome]